jgi:hypothetical protein
MTTMPFLKKRTLIQRSIAKALQTPLNFVAGAAGIGATWWLHDPTWAIVWGAGAAGWVVIATTTQRYRPRIQEEERRRRELKEERDREALRLRTQRMLDETPFDLWIHAGYLPDYMAVFARLLEIRNRVSRVLAERRDLDAFTKEDILQQLSTMLTAYLGFVNERVSYLHILASVLPVPAPPAASNSLPAWRRDWRRLSARLAPAFVPPLPSLEKRLSEVGEKIRQIRDLATREPATARTREFHIGILKKQRELLLDCHPARPVRRRSTRSLLRCLRSHPRPPQRLAVQRHRGRQLHEPPRRADRGDRALRGNPAPLDRRADGGDGPRGRRGGWLDRDRCGRVAGIGVTRCLKH